MKKYPLWIYVIAVVAVLAIGSTIAWSIGGAARLRSFGLFASGFWLGMLAMYIAVHIYRWK